MFGAPLLPTWLHQDGIPPTPSRELARTKRQEQSIGSGLEVHGRFLNGFVRRVAVAIITLMILVTPFIASPGPPKYPEERIICPSFWD